MSGNWFSGFVPVIREDATVAEAILATTAAMKRDGSFENTSICWSPADLELLAMFAIDAKYQLARISTQNSDIVPDNLPLPSDPISTDES